MPSGNDILKINMENNPHVIASDRPGITVNRLAIHPIDRNASKSNSNPLRMRMTLRPAARISLDHLSGKSSTHPPGTFLNTRPNINIPMSGGNPNAAATAPPMCAHAQINAAAQTPPPRTTTLGPSGDITLPNANRSIAQNAHDMTQNDALSYITRRSLATRFSRSRSLSGVESGASSSRPPRAHRERRIALDTARAMARIRPSAAPPRLVVHRVAVCARRRRVTEESTRDSSTSSGLGTKTPRDARDGTGREARGKRRRDAREEGRESRLASSLHVSSRVKSRSRVKE
jgi:hypothetical protein